MYVPSFFESIIVLLVAMLGVVWVRRRDGRVERLVLPLVAGVTIAIATGGYGVAVQQPRIVVYAQYGSMLMALCGLAAVMVWGIHVRGRAVQSSE